MRQIVHIEIPSHDAAESKAFYGALLGWGSMDIPMPDMGEEFNYTILNLGESMAAALAPLSDDIKPGDVLLYFGSDDLDADMARVSELGGTVLLPRQDIPGFGSLGLFLDPTGNRVAFWQNAADSEQG